MTTKHWALVLGAALPTLAFAEPEADFGRAVRTVEAATSDASAAAKSLLAAGPASGGRTETVIRDRTTVVPVALNAGTVKCSAADYSAPMLKILVPDLAQLTVLNHRNTREGAPCIAAGQCGEVGPQDILKFGEGTELVPVRVTLKKAVRIEGEACRVTLIETVRATVRGVAFFHERSQDVAERAPEDCR